MKKLILLTFALVLLLSACGREAAPTGETEAAVAVTEITSEVTSQFVVPELPLPLTETGRETTTANVNTSANISETISLPKIMQTATISNATGAATAATVINAGTVATTTSTARTTTKTNTPIAATTRYVYVANTARTTAVTTQTTTASSTSKPTTTTTTTRTNAAATTTTTTRTSTTTTTTAPTQASVSFAIDGSAAVSYGYDVSLPARVITLNDGDSVFDLLQRSGVAVESGGNFLGVYVSAIGGLREKACGSSSGWVYEVNGARSSTSCDKYQPKNGDVIVWKYTLTG